MNFYDDIHELVRKFHDTKEYKEYIVAKENLKKNQELLDQVKEFRTKQRDMQMELFAGKEPSEEARKTLQEKYVELVKAPTVMAYFQAEIALDVVAADMQKIINEAMKELIEL